MKNFSKLIFTLIFALSAPAAIFGQQYKISSAKYDIDGSSKEKYVDSLLEFDTDQIFESEEELNSFLAQKKQLLENTRNFLEIEIEKNELEKQQLASGETLISVELIVKLVDAKHFLLLPYPKYSSSGGLTLRLKAEDTNFAGSLNTMEAGLSFVILNPFSQEKPLFKLGADFEYDFPFSLGPVDFDFLNKHDITWDLRDSSPEFSFESGIKASFEIHEIPFEALLLESISKDFYYQEFDDTFWLGTNIKFSSPIEIAKLPNNSPIVLSPFASIKYNYAPEGICIYNTDLASPVLKAGLNLEMGRIDWKDNFRNGFTVNINSGAGYNFLSQTPIYGLDAVFEAHKAFDFFGIDSRAMLLLQNADSPTRSFGYELRGIVDSQTFADGSGLEGKFCHKTQSALLLNFAVPFHLFTADWTKISSWEKISALNFEMQLSPFFDAALTSNMATGSFFDPREGFYTAGMEVLVFPERWKGICVRASMGVDLGRTVLSKIPLSQYDSSWRSDKYSPYEIFIGIGFFY